MGIELQLEGEALQSALHLAIVQSLSGQAQTALVEEVVRFLTKDTTDYNGRPAPSVLRAAVFEAARKYATKYIGERLESDEDFKAQLNDLYKTVLDRVLKKDREKLEASLERALHRAFDEYRG